MEVPSTILLTTFLSLLLVLNFPSPTAANEGNIIVTGDVLQTDSQLTTPNAVFVIQNDCNLVLYNAGLGFESGTNGLGQNCTAIISEYGQLQVKNADGAVIWSSDPAGPKGNYAAILQPDGQVGIYGPTLWTVRKPVDDNAPSDTVVGTNIESEPNFHNMIFSSEVLNEKMKLVSRDYALEVKEGCSLEFSKGSLGVWSNPKNNKYSVNHCFLRLNSHGQLSLVSDNYKVIWNSNSPKEYGVYALVVKINGEATIYGKRIWST